MNTRLLLLFAALCCMVSACQKTASTPTSSDLKAIKLDTLFTYCHDHGMLNGAVAIVRNDTVLFKGAYGETITTSGKEINPETLFYLASLSKQFTAMAIMILQERKLLSYDDSITMYLPELTALNKDITIRNLLNHTAGISDRAYYQLKDPGNEEVIEAIKEMEPEQFGKPNQSFAYVNTGYVLLASIVETVSGKPLDRFFQEEIFTPLAMERTFVGSADFLADENRVQPYDITGQKADYTSSVVGPGGIYSTINDLIKWNTSLNQHTLVSQQTIELAFTNGTIGDDEPISFELSHQTFGYGFGWMPFVVDSHQVVRHDGSTSGYRSLIRKDRSANVDILLLTNHGGGFAMDEIVKGINEIIFTSQYSTPTVPITNRVVNDLKTQGIDFAIEQLRGYTKGQPVPDERVLGRLGYTYLQHDLLDEAIGLFEFNQTLHPQSVNALYVLGEAYLASEQYEAAKSTYDKFLVLKPADEHAVQRLKMIGAYLAGEE